LPERALIPERPFPSGMLIAGHATNLKTFASAYCLNGLIDLWALDNHMIPIGCADIVQVDINGKPRNVKEEKIECASSLEHQFFCEKRVAAESTKKVEKLDDLLEDIRSKTCAFRFLEKFLA
jgi:hypothetical protein